MAIATKTLVAIVILSLLGEGFGAAEIECHHNTSDIKISQKPTGVQIKGSPEYEVTFYNACLCTQTDVVLSCPGFTSVEDIGSNLTPRGDGTCLLTDGLNPLHGFTTIKVKYASASPCTFTPLSSQVYCS
ncbi:hypothetical protein MKW94_014042 [Papaver nudicaule]|uniref:Uncharacterized protein n=1 Tax=Papaver nudicaule TaxID=74823 RepID=A0AA42B1X6_PAPNU|nr:hypothetical protein [Papaver nudicaule]